MIAVLLAQIMHGIEFGGDAFMATPAVVEFKDLEVGWGNMCKLVLDLRFLVFEPALHYIIYMAMI